MLIRQIVFYVVLLTFTPFLASGQNVATSPLPSRAIDLVNKTFVIVFENEGNKTKDDLELSFIFREDHSATFRTKMRDWVNDSPLVWRFEGDSLCLQAGSIKIEAGGNVEQYEREPNKYAVTKAPGGYALKSRDDKMFLREQK